MKKRVNSSGTSFTTDRTLVQNSYDELGQLRNKKLAGDLNSNAGIENLAYELMPKLVSTIAILKNVCLK